MTRSAVAYIRASTEDQINSLDAQRSKLEQYGAYKGIHLAEVFIDAGVSGSVPFAQRPEASAMLSFMQEAGIAEIIFTKVDRAFRDCADCLITIRSLHQQGIEVHALDLDLDTATANGKLMLGVLALLAEWELGRRRERQEEALAILRRDSRRIGEVPYGFLAVADATLPRSRRENPGCRLVADPHEQIILEEIFVAAGAWGWGAARIATWLTGRGIPTKKGKAKWRGATVQGILDRGAMEDGRTAADFARQAA